MNVALFVFMLVAQVVTPAPTPAPSSDDSAWLEVEPDAILRGATSTIVVVGADAEAIKTLQFDPPDGLQINAITPLAPRGGRPAAEVSLTVAATASSGDRSIMLTVAPNISMGSASRPGGDPLTAQRDAAFLEIMKRETKPEEYGTLHINSHMLEILDLQITGRSNSQLQISVVDAIGDVEVEGRSAPASGDAILEIESTVTAEATCEGEEMVVFVDEVKVQKRQASSVVLLADFESEIPKGRRGCELRVRVQDREGNVSRWFRKPFVP